MPYSRAFSPYVPARPSPRVCRQLLTFLAKMQNVLLACPRSTRRRGRPIKSKRGEKVSATSLRRDFYKRHIVSAVGVFALTSRAISSQHPTVQSKRERVASVLAQIDSGLGTNNIVQRAFARFRFDRRAKYRLLSEYTGQDCQSREVRTEKCVSD